MKIEECENVKMWKCENVEMFGCEEMTGLMMKWNNDEMEYWQITSC